MLARRSRLQIKPNIAKGVKRETKPTINDSAPTTSLGGASEEPQPLRAVSPLTGLIGSASTDVPTVNPKQENVKPIVSAPLVVDVSVPAHSPTRASHSSSAVTSPQILGSSVNPLSPHKRIAHVPKDMLSPRNRLTSTCEVPVNKNRRRKFNGDEVLDTKSMRMMDMIYWNPKKEQGLNRKSAGDDLASIAGDAAPSLADSPVKTAAPQVKLGPDGRLVLDESSLVVPEARNDSSIWETVDEDRVTRKVTSLSFRNRMWRKGTAWTEKETEMFYEILRSTGPDFGLMHEFFPSRARNELKSKFNREERNNWDKMKQILSMPSLLDESLYDRAAKMEKEIEEEALAKAQAKEKGAKKKANGNVHEPVMATIDWDEKTADLEGEAEDIIRQMEKEHNRKSRVEAGNDSDSSDTSMEMCVKRKRPAPKRKLTASAKRILAASKKSASASVKVKTEEKEKSVAKDMMPGYDEVVNNKGDTTDDDEVMDVDPAVVEKTVKNTKKTPVSSSRRRPTRKAMIESADESEQREKDPDVHAVAGKERNESTSRRRSTRKPMIESADEAEQPEKDSDVDAVAAKEPDNLSSRRRRSTRKPVVESDDEAEQQGKDSDVVVADKVLNESSTSSRRRSTRKPVVESADEAEQQEKDADVVAVAEQELSDNEAEAVTCTTTTDDSAPVYKKLIRPIPPITEFPISPPPIPTPTLSSRATARGGRPGTAKAAARPGPRITAATKSRSVAAKNRRRVIAEDDEDDDDGAEKVVADDEPLSNDDAPEPVSRVAGSGVGVMDDINTTSTTNSDEVESPAKTAVQDGDTLSPTPTPTLAALPASRASARGGRPGTAKAAARPGPRITAATKSRSVVAKKRRRVIDEEDDDDDDDGSQKAVVEGEPISNDGAPDPVSRDEDRGRGVADDITTSANSDEVESPAKKLVQVDDAYADELEPPSASSNKSKSKKADATADDDEITVLNPNPVLAALMKRIQQGSPMQSVKPETEEAADERATDEPSTSSPSELPPVTLPSRGSARGRRGRMAARVAPRISKAAVTRSTRSDVSPPPESAEAPEDEPCQPAVSSKLSDDNTEDKGNDEIPPIVMRRRLS